MPKRDTLRLLNVLSNLIQGLSEEQYEKLLEGKATLQYVETNPNEEANQEFEELSAILNKRNGPEASRLLKTYKKPFLQAYCDFLELEIKTRDTKAQLCQKLLSHFNKEENVKVVLSDFSKISTLLEKQTTLEDAFELLINQPVSQTKAKLTQLAKHLDVYVTSKDKKDAIIERIVDSVVGAKIRGKVIRNKS